MNAVFARVLLALTLTALPGSAFASLKPDKAKPSHSHAHPPVSAKESKTKKAKHARKAKDSHGVATSSSTKSR